MQVLKPDEITDIAEYIYTIQVEKISKALLEVSKRNNIDHVVTTGLGMDIIGAKACEMADLDYTGMDKIFKKEDCVVAPAIGTAILMYEYMENKL